MAANCDVCGKGPGFGHNISHSHRRTKRRWNPNIQRVRAVVGSTPKRINVCTSCIKAGKSPAPDGTSHAKCVKPPGPSSHSGSDPSTVTCAVPLLTRPISRKPSGNSTPSGRHATRAWSSPPVSIQIFGSTL